MRILYLSGGLGSQIMQYIFKRYREFNSHTTFLIDDTHFYFPQNQEKLQINKIFPNLEFKTIKDELESDVFDSIVEMCCSSNDEVRLPNIFLANGLDISVIAEIKVDINKNYQYDGPYVEVNSKQLYTNQFGFISLANGSSIKDDDGKICFMGNWHNPEFGLAIKDVVLNELKFPELKDDKNIQYKDDISSQNYAVGVHVRRGDFVELNLAKSIEEYSKTIRKVRFDLIKQNKTPSFFIFSDDLEWCKQNKDKFKFGLDDHVVFVEGNNTVDTSYLDMQLMTYCNALISLKDSAFALSAMVLSHNDITLHQF